MALSLGSRIGSSVLIRRRIPFVGAFCVLSLGFSSLSSSFSSSSYKPGCAQSLSFAPLLRLASRSSLWFLVYPPPYEHWRLLFIGLDLAVRLLHHRSEWRRGATLCLALLSTSLFLTEKQVRIQFIV